MNRRQFTKKTLLGSAFLSSIPLTGFSNPAQDINMANKRKIKKGIMWATLRAGDTIEEKFMAAKQAGLDGIEMMSHLDRDEVLAARDKTGLEIPSVCGSLHGRYPLSDPDPAVRKQGVDALRHTIEDAGIYGADTVLLVPGRVTNEVSYDQCWNRSIPEIRKVITLAERLNISIAIENVWNNFLLSPLEAAHYVDQFNSPFVRFYFDVGNIRVYGWPEQWINILSNRIAKVHIKEYSMQLAESQGRRAGFGVDLMDGDIDWPEVMNSLDNIGYSDWAILEQPGGDTLEGLTDLSTRLGKILEA